MAKTMAELLQRLVMISSQNSISIFSHPVLTIVQSDKSAEQKF